MIKTTLKLSVFALLTACASSQVETDYEKNNQTEPGRGGMPTVEEVFKMDENSDGKLSRSEVNGKLSEDFDKFDTDGDGFITKEEFKNAPKPQGGRGGGQHPPQKN